MEETSKSTYEKYKKWCWTSSFNGPTNDSIMLDLLEEYLNDEEIKEFYYEPDTLFALTGNSITKFSKCNEEKEIHIIPFKLIKDIKIIKKSNQDYNALIIYNNNDILTLKAKDTEMYNILKKFVKHLANGL